MRRKISVNLIQILYLLFFIVNTVFDMSLFFAYREPTQRANYLHGTVDKLYKVSEVVYVNWLNALNLTVGLLYWKAGRAYYVLSDLETPLVYRRAGKVVFVFLFAIIAVAVGLVPIYLFALEDSREQSNRVEFAVFTLVSTSVSMGTCISCRILFRKHILVRIQLSRSAVAKERLISILLFTSSILRLAVYSLDVSSLNWVMDVRKQQMDADGMCRDEWMYYAVILLGINLLINLLPAAIYGHMFVSEVDYRANQQA
mgnify:CR=1 FL=1